MATDGGGIDEAWGRIPQARESPPDLGSFTLTRMERVIGIVVGLGTLVVGGQAMFAAMGGGVEAGRWHTPLVVVTFAPLAAMGILLVVGRWGRFASGVYAVVYVAVLVAWPFVTAESTPQAEQQPWIFYLINVATVAAVIAFPIRLQIAWTLVTPVLFGVVRLIQGDFRPEFWSPIAYDVSFAIMLGGVLLALGWMFRGLAVGVDDARADAVASYAHAAAAEAAEEERIAVAALMHDSVLAALIAAERAESPRQRQLAVAMARDAMTRLANAESGEPEGSDAPRPPAWIADELQRAATEFGVRLTVDPPAVEGAVPGRVARAIVLAATQALANAVQHAAARGVRIDVDVAADRDGAEPAAASAPEASVAKADRSDGSESVPGVQVTVADRGGGFDLDAIPADRLGIRASIFARMTAVGGHAAIDSGSRGTRVILTWTGGEE